jgi:hypothetical protein
MKGNGVWIIFDLVAKEDGFISEEVLFSGGSGNRAVP